MKVAVIGGGAAGFFSAIQIKTNYPHAQLTLFEKTRKLLSKVRISGGGRCNVTNACSSPAALVAAYPRGGKLLKKAFSIFNNQHTQAWFTQRGVALKCEPDNRVFPVSDSSQSIIDCLLHEAQQLGVHLQMGTTVQAIVPKATSRIGLTINGQEQLFDKVVVATGGSPKLRGLQWLADIGHSIQTPVPSLFTFNMPRESITDLMGVVAPNALASIQGSKLKAAGPVLITHWGMSGPAILKLSAFGARLLQQMQYQFKVQLNWVNVPQHDEVRAALMHLAANNTRKRLANVRPFDLPKRLWHYLLEKSELPNQKVWGELGKKGVNKLVNLLTHDIYSVQGKTTFKDEFVTCGGVTLQEIYHKSMQSKIVPNLYFAGEVLDIDGITGGYNFQAAWTTAYIAGKLN